MVAASNRRKCVPEPRNGGWAKPFETQSPGRAWVIEAMSLLALIAVCLGCAGLRHGSTYQRYRGRYLEASKPSGIERLRIERDYDPTVDQFLKDYGEPDLVFVESRYQLYLIYLQEDFIAVFQRPALSSAGHLGILNGIPDAVRQEVSQLPGRRAIPPQKQPPDEADRQETNPESQDAVSVGSSFVVASGGLLLTSAHVVDGASAIAVRCPGEEAIPASIFAFDAHNDLAVLEAAVSREIPSLHLANASSAPLGAEVFTVGYPAPGLLGLSPKYAGGEISAHSGLGDDPTWLQLTIPIQPGNSGGPVVTKQGSVVGIIASSAAADRFLEATGAPPQNVNWAVKADYALPLLPKGGRSLHSPSTPEEVAKSVCLVVATR